MIRTYLLCNACALFSACATAQAPNPNCARTATFGAKEICLPKIPGYTECYLRPNVKALADATEAPENEVLGYYLDDATFASVDSLGNFAFDNYLKVYSTDALARLPTDPAMVGEMYEAVGAAFAEGGGQAVKEAVDKLDLGVPVGVPVKVKSYRLDERSFTYVLLIDYGDESMGTRTVASTVNGLLLNRRLVWMAYYLNYEGVATIDRLEATNKQLVGILLAEN